MAFNIHIYPPKFIYAFNIMPNYCAKLPGKLYIFMQNLFVDHPIEEFKA